MENFKKLTAIVLSTMFVSMQMSFATCMDTGLGNGIGGATINNVKGGFVDMTKGTNKADLNFNGNSIVNWNTLNVNKGETLNFNAVNGTRNITVLNNVNQGMSKLYGDINANKGISNIIISNPNGVLFDGTHFTSAGDVMISTQDMSNLNLNDLTNKNFKKGEFKNLYDCKGNPIGIQATNDTTFEVAGKLNIISQNHKMTVDAKQKLVTNNGLDYLEFDGHACNNCTNKAINDNGNIIIVDINTAEMLPKPVQPVDPQPVQPEVKPYRPHHPHHPHHPNFDKPQKHHGDHDFIISNGRVGYNITKDFQRVKPISKDNDVIKNKMPGHDFIDKNHYNHIGHGNRPAFDGHRPDFNGHRPDFNGHKPDFNGHKPDFNGHRPDFNGHRPDFNGHRPAINDHANKPFNNVNRPNINNQDNHVYYGHTPKINGQKVDFNKPNNHRPDFNGQRPDFNKQHKEPDFIVSNGQVGYNITKDFQRVKPITKSKDVLVDKVPGHDFLDKTPKANFHPQGQYQPKISTNVSYNVTGHVSAPSINASDYIKRPAQTTSNIPTQPYVNIGVGIVGKVKVGTKPVNPCSGSACSAKGLVNSFAKTEILPSAIKTNNATPATNVKLSEQYYLRGLQKMVLGDLEGGKADFTKAIENNAKNADALYYRANINKQMGNLDGFNADYSKAVSIDASFQKLTPINSVAYKF